MVARLPDPNNIVGGGGGGRTLFCWSLVRSLLSFSFATSSSKMEGWSLFVISGSDCGRERVKWEKINRSRHHTYVNFIQQTKVAEQLWFEVAEQLWQK